MPTNIAFPFSKQEWSTVSEAARAVVNATFAEDDVLHATALVGLESVLEELRAAYGPHPVLLETQADFADDPAERVDLYTRAQHEARRLGLHTASICVDLARVLLDHFADSHRARAELESCREEIASSADASLRADWDEFRKACDILGPGEILQ